MNVLQLIPNMEAGGAERAVIDVSRALTAAGHKAFVMSAGGRMVEELKKTGAVHVQAPINSKNPFKIWKNADFLTRFIRDNKIDVIHARSRAPAWSAYLASRRASIPFVTTFHAAYKSNYPFKTFYNGIMARSDAMIAVSHFIKSYIEKTFSVDDRKIIVIPRGIDFSVFDPGAVDAGRAEKFAAQFEIAPETKLIIFPGRLSPIKGQALAIEALAAIKEIPYLCLFIGPDQGRDAYRQQLEALIQAEGLADKVRLVSHTDLMAAYARADLVLSVSQVAEGFGRVPVEAQAFGVPVIATALGATNETVRDGETGWLVPLADQAALEKKIRLALSLSADARGTLKQKAMAHVRGLFDVKKMAADTLAVYAHVYNARTGRVANA